MMLRPKTVDGENKGNQPFCGDWYDDNSKHAQMVIAWAKMVPVKVMRSFQNLDLF